MTYLFQLLKLSRVRRGRAVHYHYVIILLRHHMLYTVDVGYKYTLGSRKICSYKLYKVYSKFENCFQNDSYFRNIFVTGVLNWHPLHDTIGYNRVAI